MGKYKHPIYFVDFEMMGPDFKGGNVGLQQFCEILQRHVGEKIIIMPLTEPDDLARNRNRKWKEEVLSHWPAALAEYVPPAEDWFKFIGNNGTCRKLGFVAMDNKTPTQLAIICAKSLLLPWNCTSINICTPAGRVLYEVFEDRVKDYLISN